MRTYEEFPEGRQRAADRASRLADHHSHSRCASRSPVIRPLGKKATIRVIDFYGEMPTIATRKGDRPAIHPVNERPIRMNGRFTATTPRPGARRTAILLSVMVDETASLQRVTAIAVEHHGPRSGDAPGACHRLDRRWHLGIRRTDDRTAHRAPDGPLRINILFSGDARIHLSIPLLPRPMSTFAGFSQDNALPSLAGELAPSQVCANRRISVRTGFSSTTSDRPSSDHRRHRRSGLGRTSVETPRTTPPAPPGKILSATLAAYWMFSDHDRGQHDPADAGPSWPASRPVTRRPSTPCWASSTGSSTSTSGPG